MGKGNYENLQFDVTKFGGKVKIQDAYPELLPYKDYLEITSDEWKVAILMTDVGSDFVKIKDQNQKIEAIFNDLGLDTVKNRLIFDQAVNYRAGNLMDACSFLIEYQNNHKFAAWYEQNKLYYEILHLIRLPRKEGDDEDKYFSKKMERQGKLKTMEKDLEDLERVLFGTAAMKAAAFRSKKKSEINWNEKYAQENQVE